MDVSSFPYIFLLGGHDLEMKAISQWLDELQIPYHDRNLGWSNAHLSAYQDLFPSLADRVPVGIELKTNIAPPPRYRLIDYHKYYSTMYLLSKLRDPTFKGSHHILP